MYQNEPMLLSRREQQLVNALKQGRSAKEIAAELDLTVNTVRAYLRTIYSKLHVHSALELLAELNPTGSSDSHDHKRLLEAIQLVLGAREPEAVRTSLAAALKSCTAATQVSFWVVQAAPHALAIALPCGARQGPPPDHEFLTALIEHGWAIHPSRVLSQASTSPHRGERPGGAQRRAIGATLTTFGGTRQLVLATDPAGRSFNGADVKAVLTLAAVAGRLLGRSSPASAASA